MLVLTSSFKYFVIMLNVVLYESSFYMVILYLNGMLFVSGNRLLAFEFLPLIGGDITLLAGTRISRAGECKG